MNLFYDQAKRRKIQRNTHNSDVDRMRWRKSGGERERKQSKNGRQYEVKEHGIYTKANSFRLNEN